MSGNQIEGRVPVFELHIRPMIRLLDREHMISSFDLWDLQSVWEARMRILSVLRGSLLMPPASHGGPWPPEWIALFERWMSTGTDLEPGHHLVLATAPVEGFLVQQEFGGAIRLRATVQVESSLDRAWLDLSKVEEKEREYYLQREPAYPALPASSYKVVVTERIPKGSLQRIVVIHAEGREEVSVP